MTAERGLGPDGGSDAVSDSVDGLDSRGPEFIVPALEPEIQRIVREVVASSGRRLRLEARWLTKLVGCAQEPGLDLVNECPSALSYADFEMLPEERPLQLGLDARSYRDSTAGLDRATDLLDRLDPETCPILACSAVLVGSLVTGNAAV